MSQIKFNRHLLRAAKYCNVNMLMTTYGHGKSRFHSQQRLRLWNWLSWDKIIISYLRAITPDLLIGSESYSILIKILWPTILRTSFVKIIEEMWPFAGVFTRASPLTVHGKCHLRTKNLILLVLIIKLCQGAIVIHIIQKFVRVEKPLRWYCSKKRKTKAASWQTVKFCIQAAQRLSTSS